MNELPFPCQRTGVRYLVYFMSYFLCFHTTTVTSTLSELLLPSSLVWRFPLSYCLFALSRPAGERRLFSDPKWMSSYGRYKLLLSFGRIIGFSPFFLPPITNSKELRSWWPDNTEEAWPARVLEAETNDLQFSLMLTRINKVELRNESTSLVAFPSRSISRKLLPLEGKGKGVYNMQRRQTWSHRIWSFREKGKSSLSGNTSGKEKGRKLMGAIVHWVQRKLLAEKKRRRIDDRKEER